MSERIPHVNVGDIVVTMDGRLLYVTEKRPNRKVYKIQDHDGCYSWMRHTVLKRTVIVLDKIGKLLYV